jgi:hypothetical protein
MKWRRANDVMMKLWNMKLICKRKFMYMYLGKCFFNYFAHFVCQTDYMWKFENFPPKKYSHAKLITASCGCGIHIFIHGQDFCKLPTVVLADFCFWEISSFCCLLFYMGYLQISTFCFNRRCWRKLLSKKTVRHATFQLPWFSVVELNKNMQKFTCTVV